jgi:hypothetical protein
MVPIDHVTDGAVGVEPGDLELVHQVLVVAPELDP